MVRSEVTRRIAACAAVGVFFLLFAGCPLDLRCYVEWLKTRDTLIPIDEILIASAGDNYQMGDGTIGPNPTRRQQLTYSFVMSKYEITNAQFKVFMDQGGYTTADHWTSAGWTWLVGMWPSAASRKPAKWDDPLFNSLTQPVVGISWHEAVAYCNWRSAQEGLTVSYNLSTGSIITTADGYRLPTLVEREYAAAKGDPSYGERLYPWGDEVPDSSLAVFNTTATMAVGSKSPTGDTPQGLADMSGNAVEWCSDNSWLPLDNATDAYYCVDINGATAMIMRGGAYSSAGSDELRNSNNMTMASAMPGERWEWFGFPDGAAAVASQGGQTLIFLLMSQWYEELFEDYARSYDREAFTQGTLGEVDFIEKELGADRSRRILDVGCGTGRHAIELTRRGYRVTGVDLSEAQLARAREKAREAGVSVEFLRRDARDFRFETAFDLVLMICEGAFPLMETDDMNFAILRNVSAALAAEGKLILTTLSALYPLYHSVKDFLNRGEAAGGTQTGELSFDLMSFREHATVTVRDDHGRERVIQSNERYYAPSEMSWQLRQAGFRDVGIYGCDLGAFSRTRPLSTDDFEMLVVAQK